MAINAPRFAEEPFSIRWDKRLGGAQIGKLQNRLPQPIPPWKSGAGRWAFRRHDSNPVDVAPLCHSLP
jgi:hypothetical protein